MLENFKNRSSKEKKEIVTNEKEWHEFWSSFNGSDKYENKSDLKKIFQNYYDSLLEQRVLIDHLTFKTDNNQLPIEILKALFNANRITLIFLFYFKNFFFEIILI